MSLETFTSPLLKGARHGFFARSGGVSDGLYTSLNCGPGSNDRSEAVSENRARIATAMEVAPEGLLTVHQVHSADVVVVTDPPDWSATPKADALVTDRPDIALAVLTADCAPVLFADVEAGVVGAAHAGWRGALAGVLDATVEAMEGLGARRENTRAVVGPTISQRNYEVGPEMFDQFRDEEAGFERYFAPGPGDRMLFDLPGFALERLRDVGVDAEWTGHCTYADPERFFSYRRATHRGEADYGRLIASIAL